MRKILLAIALAVPIFIAAQQGMTPEDQKKVQEIRAKHDRGEALSAEDQAFIKRMTALRNGQSGASQKGAPKANRAQIAHKAENDKWIAEHPPRESTGMIPLNDLGKGAYKGEQGGLYPGGVNTMPPAHLKAGLKMATEIVPLDKDGKKSPDGKIVLISIGISNTTMEFQTFMKVAAADKEINPHVMLVDCAQPGQPAAVAADPKSHYWEVNTQRLETAGVTNNQVQVLWIKETYPLYDGQLPFPGEPKKLEDWQVGILHTTKDRFPNLKIAYLSSRIYAGYSVSVASPEPFAYEYAFSNKWMIADQIAGKPELNYDPAKGQMRSPWIAWGPYMWADGMKPRSDGLTWVRSELGNDGMHPSDTGRLKVSKLLMDFLKTDPTSKTWFLK